MSREPLNAILRHELGDLSAPAKGVIMDRLFNTLAVLQGNAELILQHPDTSEENLRRARAILTGLKRWELEIRELFQLPDVGAIREAVSAAQDKRSSDSHLGATEA